MKIYLIYGILHVAQISHEHFPFSCTGEKIFPVAWEVIEALELFDIPVVSVTSDGAKPNRKFYKLCHSAGLPYKTTTPFRQKSDIYFFCDPLTF